MRPRNVFVYGGGPAAALTNEPAKGSMRRSGFVLRQSLISAFSGPSAATIGPASSPRPVEVRLLNADIRGSLCGDIAAAAQQTDVVLIDLFDERFGVELLGDGTYITRSPERVKHVATAGPSRRVAFGNDEHFELWRAAADRFVSFLVGMNLLAHTYLLDIAWAHSDESGLDAELPFGLTSAEANIAFARYVEHLRHAGVRVVSHSSTWTSRGHKWGPAPYNFHEDVYAAVAAKLRLEVGDAVGSSSAAVSRLWVDPVSDREASAAIPTHARKKLVWLDTIFCDAETDAEILERYMARFMMTLQSIGQQRVSRDTDLRLVVHLSRDKSLLAPKIQAAFDRFTNGLRATSTIHFYDHPAQGYGVPEGSHVDRLKNPNKQSGRRERLFADASRGLNFGDYSAVVRISMDDDDLYLPGHLDQISALADDVLQETPNSPSALGMYQCYLAHVGDDASRMERVSFNRVIPGNKFFVVPSNRFSNLADYSPWSIPEYIDDEAAEAFMARGIRLTLARNNLPTFIYMRRSFNLSRQSKEHFIDAVHESRTFANEMDLVATVAGWDDPRPATHWHLQPLDRVLRLSCTRMTGDVIRAETNFSRMFGPGHQIAYYLMKDGSRIDAKWYSSDDIVFFDAPAEPCSVRVFVRKNGKIIDRAATRHLI